MTKAAGLMMAVAVAFALAGCGHSTVEDACEKVSTCPNVNETCVEDGKAVEAEALEKGCEGAFEDYLDCIDAAACESTARCGAEVTALDDCGVDTRFEP